MFTYKSGAVFTGQYTADERNGLGENKLSNGQCYVGEWKDGKMSGRMVFNDQNVSIMLICLFCTCLTCDTGHGQYTWPSGAVYKGEFSNDCFHGHGVLTRADKTVRSGSWLDDKEV